MAWVTTTTTTIKNPPALHTDVSVHHVHMYVMYVLGQLCVKVCMYVPARVLGYACM